MNAKSWLGLAAVGLVALFLMTGCTEETPPGGPGALTTTPEGEPAEPEATFTLAVPTGARNIEQGESETLTIGVDRGEEFQDEVAVTFQPPEGITIDPEQATIVAGEDEVDITVTVDPTVQPGELWIEVTGEAPAGPPTTGKIAIEVTEKEETTPGETPRAKETPPADVPPADEPLDVNPEEGAPAAEDPAAAPKNPVNPEEGAPAVREEDVDPGEVEAENP
ncbi:MAG: hypothetical protein KY475_20495 [Planctomycetes bacterium]|nr:hypothetical protein [Planctomycetota bacterium]